MLQRLRASKRRRWVGSSSRARSGTCPRNSAGRSRPKPDSSLRRLTLIAKAARSSTWLLSVSMAEVAQEASARSGRDPQLLAGREHVRVVDLVARQDVRPIEAGRGRDPVERVARLDDVELEPRRQPDDLAGPDRVGVVELVQVEQAADARLVRLRDRAQRL